MKPDRATKVTFGEMELRRQCTNLRILRGAHIASPKNARTSQYQFSALSVASARVSVSSQLGAGMLPIALTRRQLSGAATVAGTVSGAPPTEIGPMDFDCRSIRLRIAGDSP